MNALEHGPDVLHCVRHPSQQTSLRCGKCGVPICTRCLVQTPVGARCPACANLKRLPQFDVGLLLFSQSFLAGLAVSAVGWFVLSYVSYLRYFLSILVGVSVGETMSRLARRRTNFTLEAAAVVAVIVGLLGVEMLRSGYGVSLFQAMANDPGVGTSLVLPAAIASIIVVVKLRS